MSLTPGARLGPYEITGAIGAGGMGEVFRARDTKLNREVAIKVLPAAFADDPERLARFTREAQTLASLNHPNIAAIYGIEEIASSASSDGLVAMTKGAGASRALVMELVEGEDLSSHVSRGPIPIAEALPIARQIAEALEAAHEQGIVHRDLKPANIKVRTDGTVKVLDFGLAKAMDSSGPSSPNVSHSPTLTHQGTMAGMIIGTAAYMSPEQAKGKTVDKRTDIWAFGVVLYEMLTGSRLFAAEDVSETLAAVLTRDVNLKALPPGTPTRLRALVSDCLIRDSKQRLRDMGHARIEIARIEAGTPDTADGRAQEPPTAKRTAWPWVIAATFAAAFFTAILAWAPWRTEPGKSPRALEAGIGVDASLVIDRGASAILSPDGATFAFVARKQDETRLFVRKLDQLRATPLAGTEDASYPFFSPDSEWIAFFAGGKLKKVSVRGGAIVTLCDAPDGRGGAWSEDDTIIFSPVAGSGVVLERVAAAGGTKVALGTLGQGGSNQRWPQALPGGKAVLFTENTQTRNFDYANIVVTPLSAAGEKAGPSKVVVSGGYYGRYVPSGHIVYVHQGTLFAAPFDPVRLETVGPAVPAIEGLASSSSSGGAQVAFSAEGTVVYVPGLANSNFARPVDWLTRDGRTAALRASPSEWSEPDFSPDGRKLALVIHDGKQRDIWVYDLARDTLTQLTFDSGDDTSPVWTPDGRHIVFGSNRARPGGPNNLYWVNADGTGEVTRMTDSPEFQQPWSWHPSGRFLAFTSSRPGTGQDLLILPIEGDGARGISAGTPTVFLATPAMEYAPRFSPDGRFVAYHSNEGGNLIVYVRPFPGPGGRWRISTEVGGWPRWSRTAPELLFMSYARVMFARFAVQGGSFQADQPLPWAPTGIRSTGAESRYDLHPDGKRLAVLSLPDQSVVQDKVVFVFNFFDYLRTIAPVKK